MWVPALTRVWPPPYLLCRLADWLRKQQDAGPSTVHNDVGMDDDEVLLATSDEEFPSDAAAAASPERNKPEDVVPARPASPGIGGGEGREAVADDMVVVEEAVGQQQQHEGQAEDAPAAAAEGEQPAEGESGGSTEAQKPGVWQGATWSVDVGDDP
jgi:hypothetical protein